MDKRDYPIQIVTVSNTDHKPPPEAMNVITKQFCDVTPIVRQELARQCDDSLEYFKMDFMKWPGIPAVLKVTLREDAIAKSHRPQALFSKSTCPIIGNLDFGEILVSATESGIRRLSDKILRTESKKPIANISAIEKIEPYTYMDRLNGLEQSEFGSLASGGVSLKISIFDHDDDAVNSRIKTALFKLIDGLDVELKAVRYGSKQTLFKVSKWSEADSEKLSSFVGLQSLSMMPLLFPDNINLQTNCIGAVDGDLCPPPILGQEYPVVGIIDSGICPDATLLSPWIIAKENYVPLNLQDNSHGTMVAGLIINGKGLNNQDPRFPSAQAKIVDIAVFEKGKSISEDDLVTIIEEVLKKYSWVKVWNLSLGSQNPSHINQFSDFACFLDEMHDKYGCLFVVSSGNHGYLQSWPPLSDNNGLDRVSSPGDSVRSLTVGSIANKANHNSLSKVDEPSPFSRRGPGPAYIPKPEITQYGGNCAGNNSYTQTGILSIGPKNSHYESLGTSFSTPLASAQAAQIWSVLDTKNSPCYAERVKALMIHSALVRSQKVTTETLNYYGFGQPGDVIDTLYCEPNSITLMFEAELRHGGFEFERWPFPVADSLFKNEKFKGEVLMTLVYSPLLDKNFSAEYCRTNVDVGMGSYEQDETGKYKFKSLVPIAPTDVNQLFEKFRIRNGFKWSPVKAYHKTFPKGVDVNTWRLKMKVSRRAEEINPGFPQKVCLLLTMRSLSPEDQVYNEAIRKMNQAGWIHNDIDQHLKVRF